MAFIQTKYRKKSQMYKNMIRAELRDNLPVARSEFSIDTLKQIAYMMCAKFFFLLCLENGKTLSTVSPAPRHTHSYKPLYSFFPALNTTENKVYISIENSFSLESLLFDILIF